MARPRCPAKAKSTGEQCRNPAGFRTDHLGSGPCYLHGGCSPVRHGLYSQYARGPVKQILDQLDDADVADASGEIQLSQAQLAAALGRLVDEGGQVDPEWFAAISLHVSRLTLAKQRQMRLRDTLTREEFTSYITRLLVVVRRFVPTEEWEACEQAMGLVPLWLDGADDPT